MKRKNSLNLIPALGLALTLGFLLTGLPGAAGAQGVQPQDVLGGAFTYQGRLVKDGNAVTDTCAFQFSLWDAGNGGNRIGNVQTASGVSVSDGYLTVLLNDADEFGSGAFAGNERYLQIAAKCSGDSTFVPLSGRAALSAAPYALYARSAPWSGLAGVPAGFADGVDNGGDYQNVIVVARGGGDFTSIQAALNSIGDNDEANRYLVWVAPGTYTGTVTMKPYVDIQGAGELATKIIAGGSASANTGTVVGADDAELRFLTVENTGGNAYTIAMYNDSAAPRLTHVTVVASGPIESGEVYGVYNEASSPTMTGVTIRVGGGGNLEFFVGWGVCNRNRSSPWMEDVKISVDLVAVMDDANYAIGVENRTDSSPTMTNVSISVHGGSSCGVHNHTSAPRMIDVVIGASAISTACGVSNYSSSYSYSPTMVNVVITAGGTTGIGVDNEASSPTMSQMVVRVGGGLHAYGVYNHTSSATLTNVTISTGSDYGDTYGVYNEASSSTLTNVTISAGSDYGEDTYGVYNEADSGSYTVRIDNSQITSLNNTIVNDAEFTTRVGASQLAGRAVVTGGGTVTCAGVYDENYVFRASTCP